MALLALVAASAMTAFIFWGQPGVVRDGQTVFVPGGPPAIDPAAAHTGALAIEACESVEGGLLVKGSIDSHSPIVTVLVSDFDPTGPGTRVGRAFISHSSSTDAARPGDFEIVLGFADDSASFSLVHWGGQRMVANTPPIPCP